MLSWSHRKQLGTTLLLALVMALVPAAAHAGAANAPAPAAPTSVAAQGGAWNDDRCIPSDDHPRPVVLVHGTLGNKTSNWLGLAPYLANRGYCVFSLDYGKLPLVPVFHGLGPIEDSAGELAEFVDRVLDTTGADEVDLVGHSQGGMMPRYYLKHHDDAAGKVNALVALAPSTNGTTLLGLTRLFDLFPGARDLLDGLTPALEQQVAGSDFITELNRDGYTVPGVDYTVIATRYDQVVTPFRTQFIEEPGVNNVLLQDLCPVDVSEHLAIALTDRVAWHEVTNALDPANAKPTTCWSVFD
ncbi:esterase/lipase family protein [Streptomyces sp. SM12]|uniref:esterase/lipase family protein n=1 Tax=Streptomyces sp. SM12 TaxID=1071602 RepID=UPI0035B57359